MCYIYLPVFISCFKSAQCGHHRRDHRHETVEHQRDSPKSERLLCCVSRQGLCSLFLWRKHRYRTNLSRSAPKLAIHFTASRFEWLHFSTRWSTAPLASQGSGFELIWMKMCLGGELVGEMLKTSLSALGLPDPRTSLCVIFFCGGMLKTKFMFHHFQQISMTGKIE